MGDLISRKELIKDIEDRSTLPSDVWDTMGVLNIVYSQPSAQQWIPVEERLPESRKSVLIYTSRNMMAVGFIDKRKNWYVEDGDWYCTDLTVEPIAWMPLPEAYKGE